MYDFSILFFPDTSLTYARLRSLRNPCARYSVVLHRSELGPEVSSHRRSSVQPHEGAAREQPPVGSSGEVPRERARRIRPRHDTALLCDKRRRQRREVAVQGVATGAVGVVRVPHDQLRSGRGELSGGFPSSSVSVPHPFYTSTWFSGDRLW